MSKSKQENKDKKAKKSSFAVFIEEISSQSVLIPILAIFTGFVIGGIIIALTTENVYAAFSDQGFFGGLRAAWDAVILAYGSLFRAALGDPAKIRAAIASGEKEAFLKAISPISESLVATTPYIFAGLAVALGFKSGLFNIGVEGQLMMGAAASVWVGFAFTGLPRIIHLPLALLAGAIGGAIWGFIPGLLKAKTGGHEVINTIMMNYIAFRMSEWLLNGYLQRPGGNVPVSPPILESAELPRLFASPVRFHAGFFVALVFAWLVYWFVFRSRWGFDLRTVGANPHAARYAGMKIASITIMAMTLSGALGGLTGANEILGVNHTLSVGFSSGYGFDAIALALLGKNHPAGVVLAALLFGFLRSGALGMQLEAGIPIDIVSVVQALVLAFIAAPAIIRTIYRLKTPEQEEGVISLGGWGS
ncbi:MAG TPA: ABC transporter permease [Anaerolineae bacterium]|nr:ABC transporter permease [Anaerolineae bacterium]